MIYRRRVNYYETDAMKVVHHSNYIRFMEEARIKWMRDLGLPYSKMEEAGIMIPVLGVNCEYKVPAKFDDEIEVEVSFKEYSGVKFTMQYVIREVTSGNICVVGETKHCFTNMDFRPISLKKVNPEMHAIFQKMLED